MKIRKQNSIKNVYCYYHVLLSTIVSLLQRSFSDIGVIYFIKFYNETTCYNGKFGGSR